MAFVELSAHIVSGCESTKCTHKYHWSALSDSQVELSSLGDRNTCHVSWLAYGHRGAKVGKVLTTGQTGLLPH